MNELTVQEAALAWAQGKRVEAASSSTGWGAIKGVGANFGTWTPNVFNGDNSKSFRFRLAPEPPAKKYRPWTPEEVPVGALIRHKKVPGVGLILANGASSNSGMAFVDGLSIRREPYSISLDQYEHSLDNGKTWLPCGVEVTA